MHEPLIRAVLDSNVLFAAAMRSGTMAARIVVAWGNGAFLLIASSELLSEFEAATEAKANGADQLERSQTLLALIRKYGEIVAPSETPPPARSRDPRDDYVLDLAVRGHADLVVSNDKDLLSLGTVEGIPIVSAHDFAFTLGLQH